MSTNDKNFVDSAEVPETNINADKEDRLAEQSEATGQVSKEEVDSLKDSLGGGQVLDDSEGYTRSSNKDVDPLAADKKVDEAVDSLE